VIKRENKLGRKEMANPQCITAKAIKEYLTKICHKDIFADTYLAKSILRRFDKDTDGYISIEDFVKATSPLHEDQLYNIEEAKRRLCKLKLNNEIVFRK
jgi:Ca2+-binding EF-hand superfamily protein